MAQSQKFKDEGATFAESPQAQSPAARPALESKNSIHPGQHPDILNVPVTPGIHLGEYASDSSAGGPSYFSHDLSKLRSNMAQSPNDTAAGTTSDQDVLRRMSLNDTAKRRDSLSEIDPRAANPSLNLSGGVISATFAIPHSLEYRKGADWALSSRRGTSALFDSFAYLSSDKTPWNHTLVGWTGEITQMEDHTPPETPPEGDVVNTTTINKMPPLNKNSAPIPIDGNIRPATPPQAEGVWVSKEDQARLERQLSHDKHVRTVPVWLSDDVDNTEGGICLKDQARWRRYAEHELYTLFHYKQHEPTDGRAERAAWADYYRMNQKFATRILEIYKPGDIVVIHDYHLLLLPTMLRQRVPHMYISFFLHVPFPSSEFLRCLPQRKEVLEGVLGANLVGFQSYSYSRHFVSCCTRILGFPSDVAGVDAYGSKVTVGVFPIGIDAAAVEKLAFENSSIDEQATALKQLYEGKKIIVGRDRLDSVRGVAQKLQAFERFLDMYPEWREKVVLIQVTSPTSVEEEKEDSGNRIANKVSELVAKINGLYGSLGFSPVQHYPQYLSQEEYLALLRAADIGLITSVRDGMNTTSLEYVVCQRDSHGPLILSEFSGTAGSLKDAIHINPWDLSGVAEQINYALSMSSDKRSAMHGSLYHHVTTKNVQSWAASFLKRHLTILSSSNVTISTPILDKSRMLKQYREAKKRLFMFDYDGTLTPIVKDPAAAIPSDRVIRTLQALASDHRNAVWIISGRDQEFLSQYLGHIKELGFSAEHGSFMRHPGSTEWENLAETFDMDWQKEVFSCFEKYTEKTPGSFIERKRCALTWHYRPSDPELGAHNSRECQKELERTVGKKWDVEVMTGKANLEVRPTFINKGEIAKRLVEAYSTEIGGGAPPEFTLCLGDDFTDEDMFRALNGREDLDPEHVFTVTVGASSKMTLAHWHLLEPMDVISSVALLSGGVDPSVVEIGALCTVEGKVPEDEMPGGKL
ncbi:putative trehalose-6-phosphate synthase [Phlyctema vagabunda]|uniref:Trehalose-6-phosphate synthase n=1 Tax=Phlyctema vagabunda TaxID=108571 RepID=A0ABR4P8U3_9HELO